MNGACKTSMLTFRFIFLHSSFLYVEIGHNGSESDGGIFSRSKLQPMVTNCTLGIPPDACLESIGNVPYFFVSDEAFPLKIYIMRPYSKKSKWRYHKGTFRL